MIFLFDIFYCYALSYYYSITIDQEKNIFNTFPFFFSLSIKVKIVIIIYNLFIYFILNYNYLQVFKLKLMLWMLTYFT
jgi:hypothetical protein